mmetsp:Transcript_34529/g.71891  ORF Transcript_34529/g.71891 Transcript_34529/m.71891 type:complete len:207 (-) Transcript_34529:213-833(-)
MSQTNHGGPSRVLVHAVNDKGNGHGQEQDPVQLRKGILIFRKGQNGNTRPGQGDTKMHPGQKGSFIGKKDFGFNFDGGLAGFDEGANFTNMSVFGRRRCRCTKPIGPESIGRTSGSRVFATLTTTGCRRSHAAVTRAHWRCQHFGSKFVRMRTLRDFVHDFSRIRVTDQGIVTSIRTAGGIVDKVIGLTSGRRPVGAIDGIVSTGI